MKNTRIKNKITIGVVISMLLVISLAGCGKEKQVDVSEEASSQGLVSTDTSEPQQEASEYETNVEGEEVPLKWEESISNTETRATIRINASVEAADIGDMKVINITEKVYDETSKKEFIESFSEGTVYKYDLEYYTKDMLDRVIEELESWLNSETAAGDKINNLIAECEGYYENASDKLTEATDYSGERFFTTYDDKEFIISFFEYEDSFLMEYYNYSGISIELVHPEMYTNFDENIYKEVSFTQDVMYDNGSVENICQITENDAKVVAEDFVESLEIGEFGVVNQYNTYVTCQTIDSDITPSGWYDGYTFCFERSVDGVQLDTKKYQMSRFIDYQLNDAVIDAGYGTDAYYVTKGYECELILVSVNDSGVVKVSYQYPMEIKDVMAENVKLLSFDKIQDEAEYILSSSPYFKDNFYSLNVCELAYFPVRDQWGSNDRALVPVWSLSTLDNNAYILINAIDGSNINVSLNMFDITILDTE